MQFIGHEQNGRTAGEPVQRIHKRNSFVFGQHTFLSRFIRWIIPGRDRGTGRPVIYISIACYAYSITKEGRVHEYIYNTITYIVGLNRWCAVFYRRQGG